MSSSRLLVERHLGLVGDRLLGRVTGWRRGLAVAIGHQIRPADRQLRVGELDVGRRVLERTRGLDLVRLAVGARRRDAGP